jgi:UDP-glucose 4-epimerase
MSMTFKNKVLVIGGSGFLGSHVVDQLILNGYKVTNYDLQPPMYNGETHHFIQGDILDVDALKSSIRGNSAVFIFAGLSDLNKGLKDPIGTVELNILALTYILETCVQCSVSRVIYSSSIYADTDVGGFYGASKLAAEAYIREYSRIYNLNHTIVRYGSLYGDRSGLENGLYRMVKDALVSNRASYEGDAETTREYIHVADAAKATVPLLQEKNNDRTVLLSGMHPIRVRDVLAIISEVLNLESSGDIIDREYTGHYVRTPYRSKRQIEKIALSEYVDFGMGIRDLIEYVKSVEDV